MTKISKTYRLSDVTLRRIAQLKTLHNATATQVVERAIYRMWVDQIGDPAALRKQIEQLKDALAELVAAQGPRALEQIPVIRRNIATLTRQLKLAEEY